MPLPRLSWPHSPTVHIWELYLPDFQASRQGWGGWLSADEQCRAQRFYRAEDRDRFILSRGGLRYLLARYLGCSPKALAFTYSDHGKPSLVPPTLDFNLAHSGQWVTYAVSQSSLVGVDVEQTTPRTRLEGLIERCLTPGERQGLWVSSAGRLQNFLAYWTVKEAHLKAVGLGLSYPMVEVEVTWQPHPKLVKPAQQAHIPAAPWSLTLWCPAKDAIAAACANEAAAQFLIRPFPT